MKTRKNYKKFVEWSDEDQCYIGQCPELTLGGVHGDDEIEVYRELCQLVDELVKMPEVPPKSSSHRRKVK